MLQELNTRGKFGKCKLKNFINKKSLHIEECYETNLPYDTVLSMEYRVLRVLITKF